MELNSEIVDKNNISFFEWVFKLAVMVGASISAWFFKNIWESINENRKDLSKLELHISENYEKKETVQASLSRIHDRLDDMSSDIKTLIGRHNK